MRLYVSGPMSMYADTDYNFPAFNNATRILSARGYEVENPADKGVLENWKWEDYMRYDIRKLLDCQGVAVLPDWEMSSGAKLEVYIAEQLKMRIMTVDEWVTLDKMRYAVI